MRETTNYKLGLWEGQDEVGREGFNGNFSALDVALKGEADARVSGDSQLAVQMAAGLAGKSQVVAGAYVGDGTVGRVIQLGFTPSAVLVVDLSGYMSGAVTFGGLAVTGAPAYPEEANRDVLTVELVTGGFRVTYSRVGNGYAATNSEGRSFRYLAVH